MLNFNIIYKAIIHLTVVNLILGIIFGILRNSSADNELLYLNIFFSATIIACICINTYCKKLSLHIKTQRTVSIITILFGTLFFAIVISACLYMLAPNDFFLDIAIPSLVLTPSLYAIMMVSKVISNKRYCEEENIQLPYSTYFNTPNMRPPFVWHLFYLCSTFFDYSWWLDNINKWYEREKNKKNWHINIYALFPSFILKGFQNDINKICAKHNVVLPRLSRHFWSKLHIYKYIFFLIRPAILLLVIAIFFIPTASAPIIVVNIIYLFILRGFAMHLILKTTNTINMVITYNATKSYDTPSIMLAEDITLKKSQSCR